MGPEIGGSPGTPGSASIDTTSGELTTQAVSIGPRVLPVKITTWRLLNTVFLLAVGTAKAASAYRGDATVVNTLDWIIGVIWALVSYWFSILENESPNSIPWLLEYDIYEEGAIRVVIGYPLVFFLLIIVVSTISTVAMISVADLQEHAKGKTDTSGGYSTSFDIALMIGAAFLGLLVLIVGGIIVLVGLPFLFKQIVGLLWLPRMKRQLFLRSDWDVKDMWRKERMVTLILVVLIFTISSLVFIFQFAGIVAGTFYHTVPSISISFGLALGTCMSIVASMVYLIVGLARMARRLFTYVTRSD